MILKENILNIKILFIISIFFLFGLNIYFNKSKLSYNLIDFKKETKIFINRDYVNANDNDFFLTKKIIQVPRHHRKNINIFTNSKLIIYRPTCSKNINENYIKNWKIYPLKVKIKGISCAHETIFFREYDKFFLTLPSGGPISADPIFIDIIKKGGFVKILNKKLN